MMTNVHELKHRLPPYQSIMAANKPWQPGTCIWCGLYNSELTPIMKQPRKWHDACRREFEIITMPDKAREAVFARDHGICCDCQEDWSERYRYERGEEQSDGCIFTPITWVSLWQVDHKVPLWKVKHLAPLNRIEFFKLPNLITRCVTCHQFKSTDESAERHHFDRLVEVAAGVEAEPKRAFGSRPMAGTKASGWRKPMRGPAVRRP